MKQKPTTMPRSAIFSSGGQSDPPQEAKRAQRGAEAACSGISVHFDGWEATPIEDLMPYPRNARAHGDAQVALLAKSVRHQGWRWPIIVSRRSGYIVAGHGRLEAAKLLNVAAVPVVYQDFTSAKAEEAFRLADNRLPELAEQQTAIIGELLGELQAGGDFDMDLTGYTEADLATMTQEEPEGDDTGGAVDRQADDLLAKWKVEPGQLWTAGDHRILCGDATDPAAWARLMQGQKAALCNTDPPYGVSYAADQGRMIKGDNKREDDLVATLLVPAFRLMAAHTMPDAAIYIWHAFATRRDFEHAIDTVGMQERQYITWVKDSFVLGHADYHWQTEPAFYLHKPGQPSRWMGDRKQTTVWRIRPPSPADMAASITNGVRLSDGAGNQIFLTAKAPKTKKTRLIRLLEGETFSVLTEHSTDAWHVDRDPAKERMHPTQKPVKLFLIPIDNHTAPGDLIVEPFSGSGAQLVAAQRSKRRCYAMDLDPKYVAVALERLQREGLTPILEAPTCNPKTSPKK